MEWTEEELEWEKAKRRLLELKVSTPVLVVAVDELKLQGKLTPENLVTKCSEMMEMVHRAAGFVCEVKEYHATLGYQKQSRSTESDAQ